MVGAFDQRLTPAASLQHRGGRWRALVRERQRFIAGVGLLIMMTASVCAVVIQHEQHISAVSNPFDTKTLVSTPFPLYYPTDLPDGYHLDPQSVDVPQPGVVVLTLVGPHHQKIYMSQEARVSTFDYGGYYQDFSSLHETVTASGVIAVGYIDNGRTAIGSLVTSKTWIIVDTAAHVPVSQLTDVLNHLAVSH